MMFPDASDDKQRAALRMAAQRAARANSGGDSAFRTENTSMLGSTVPDLASSDSLTSHVASWSLQQR